MSDENCDEGRIAASVIGRHKHESSIDTHPGAEGPSHTRHSCKAHHPFVADDEQRRGAQEKLHGQDQLVYARRKRGANTLALRFRIVRSFRCTVAGRYLSVSQFPGYVHKSVPSVTLIQTVLQSLFLASTHAIF